MAQCLFRIIYTPLSFFSQKWFSYVWMVSNGRAHALSKADIAFFLYIHFSVYQQYCCVFFLDKFSSSTVMNFIEMPLEEQFYGHLEHVNFYSHCGLSSFLLEGTVLLKIVHLIFHSTHVLYINQLINVTGFQ